MDEKLTERLSVRLGITDTKALQRCAQYFRLEDSDILRVAAICLLRDEGFLPDDRETASKARLPRIRRKRR